ncbi:MAG: hypothetical protein ACLPND_10020 [Candidatus Korobacteraceae bacterium]
MTRFPRVADKWGMAAIEAKSVHSQGPRSAFTKDHHSPTLLICRRMVEQALHDACQVRQGRPTELALESWEWLTAKTDWTLHGGPAPPAELREGFYGSFEWACRWLGENPARVREQGLQPCANFNDGQTRREWVQGLPDVKRVWECRASSNYAPK